MSTQPKTASTKKTASKKAPASKKATKKAETKDNSEDTTEKKERTRREVSKESVDVNFTDLQSRIEAEIARLRENPDKVRGVKFLRSINKALKTLHGDTKRVMKLKKKNNRKKTLVSGFLMPIKITPELAAFTGWDVNGTYSRVNVTKHICEYIKTNQLFNTDDKRLILCDDKLKNLLKYDPANPPLDKEGNPAPLNYFRLQKYLKPHFVRIEPPATQAQSEPAAKVESDPKKQATAPAPAAAVPAKKAAPAASKTKGKARKAAEEEAETA